jgi:competence protein ComEC
MAALTFAAAVMAGISPYVLGDASFQLSFMAMAGLIFLYPILGNYGKRVVAARLGDEGVTVSLANLTVDTFGATLAAIIAVWPVVAYYFGIFSLVGPLATFLAIPALPLIIITGTLTAFIGLASPAVAQTVGWLAWLFLSYMIAVVSGLGAPAIAAVAVGSLSPVFIGLYYVVLAALVWLYGRWRQARSLMSGAAGLMRSGVSFSSGFSRGARWAIAPLAVLAVLVSFTAATMPDDNLRVSFLDVGQGDAILIQKGNQQILVDGGPSPRAITLALGSRMPFWDRSIDLLVLTHPHQDHLAGLTEVLRRYRVEQVIYYPQDYASPLYDEWRRTIEDKKVKSTFARAGQRIDLGDGAFIEVLHPPPAAPGHQPDIDNDGVVLRLVYGEVSFLLTADIKKEAEQELVRERTPLASTVLKVAHHGSDTSSAAGFLAVARPAAAVISVGADNDFGLPDEAVMDRLAVEIGGDRVYRTDECGTVDFRTDGHRLWVETDK